MTEVKAKKPWYKKWWVWALIVFIGFPAIGTLVGGGEEEGEAAPASKPKVEEKAEAKPAEKAKKEKKKDSAKVTDYGIKQAIELTTADDLVKDAAVNVEDGTIYLAIIAPAVNEEYAKELGDNFVRQLATFSEGKAPTKDYYGEIYEKYNMQVGIFGANDKKIAYGAKARTAKKITW